MTHRRAPRPAGDAIRAAREQAAPKTRLAAVQAAWVGAVGEGLAAQATPVSERGGEVTVECADAVWAQELDLQSPLLMEKLNAAIADGEVTRLRCVTGSRGPA